MNRTIRIRRGRKLARDIANAKSLIPETDHARKTVADSIAEWTKELESLTKPAQDLPEPK